MVRETGDNVRVEKKKITKLKRKKNGIRNFRDRSIFRQRNRKRPIRRQSLRDIEFPTEQ